MIQPRARKRAAPKIEPKTPMGYPVIGGPRRPAGLAPEFTHPSGYYHATPGRPINTWPWKAGSEIIGLICHEQRRVAGDMKIITTHVYRLVDREWRYLGKTSGTEAARRMIDRAYDAANAVQPVAPRRRIRPSGTNPT